MAIKEVVNDGKGAYYKFNKWREDTGKGISNAINDFRTNTEIGQSMSAPGIIKYPLQGLRSMGSAFNAGFNASGLIFRSNPGRVLGGMGIGAGVGAAIGTGLSVASDGALDPTVGAGVGAAIGAAALPVAGAVSGFAGRALTAAAPVALAGAKAVGKGAVSALPAAAGVGGLVAGRALAGVYEMGKSLIDFNKDAENLSGVTLSGFGKAALGATAFTEGLKGAVEGFVGNQMGQMMDSRTMTSRVPNYNPNDNVGATGDLVFAMHKNRRG